VRATRHHPALCQVGGLLDPATEGHAAPIESCIQFRDGVGTILGMKKCVCHRFRPPKILRPAEQARDRVVRRQRFECGAILSPECLSRSRERLEQIRDVRGSPASRAAVALDRFESFDAVEGVVAGGDVHES
jgi:hypothetical protein